MTGFLTTHVLDTARGCPAEGIAIRLYRVSGNSHTKIAEAITNADGRTDTPILRATGQASAEPLFLDQVPIRFGMSEDTHYHVPLLLSPFGMSTYRGS